MGAQQKKYRIKGRDYRLEELPLSGLPVDILSFIVEYQQNAEILAHTSGSTGKPKPILLRTVHMKTSAQKTIDYLKLRPGQSCLLCLSPKYIAGMMMLVRWMEGNLDLYFTNAVSEPLHQIDQSIHFAAMVPFQVFHSLDQLQKLDTLLVGGGAIDPSLEKSLRETRCHVYQSYGMTEAITHIALREINPHYQQSYHVLDGVEISIDNRSCLVIDSPEIGVRNLVTNDVVDLVNDSEFRWLGRHDNVVNSGGIKFYPEELEERLGDLGVTYIFGGIPDKALGEKLILVLETSDHKEVSRIKNLMHDLPRFSQPREVKCLAKFERTSTGKLRRQKILEEAFPDS